jgi:predicted nuclease with TOPRIM domain
MGEERREVVSLSEEPPGDGTTLEQELDRLSLDQALVDVEIATGRVVDLTQRLVEATETTRELQAEVEALRQERTALEAQLDEIRSTKAFRTASSFWALRHALRG